MSAVTAAYNLDNFVVGLTNTDSATTAPVYKQSDTISMMVLLHLPLHFRQLYRDVPSPICHNPETIYIRQRYLHERGQSLHEKYNSDHLMGLLLMYWKYCRIIKLRDVIKLNNPTKRALCVKYLVYITVKVDGPNKKRDLN